MADTPLFTLDAEGRFRLAYEANQWVIEQRGSKRKRGGFEGGHSEIYRWEGRWHVGSEKRTLTEYIEGERGPPLPEKDRPRIHLTPEAQFRFDTLPNTFREFQSMAIQSTAAA